MCRILEPNGRLVRKIPLYPFLAIESLIKFELNHGNIDCMNLLFHWLENFPNIEKNPSESSEKVGKVPAMLSKVPHEIVSMENGSNVHAAFCRAISSAMTTQSEEWRKGENQILSVQWQDDVVWRYVSLVKLKNCIVGYLMIFYLWSMFCKI